MADPLIEALIARSRQEYGQNPLIGVGNQIRGTSYTSPYYSTGQNLLLGALAGASGGLMSGFGQRQYEDQTKKDYGGLVDALNQSDPGSALAANPRLAEFAPIYQLQEQQRLKDIEDIVLKSNLDQQARSPFLSSRMNLPSIKAKRGAEGGIEVDIKNAGVPMVSGTSDSLKEKKEDNLFGDIPSLSEKFQAENQKILLQTGNPSAAQQGAKAMIATDTKTSAEDLKVAKEAREKARALKNNGLLITSLADKVGYTGYGGSVSNKIKSALIPFENLSGLDFGLNKEVTNAQLLESTIPSAISIAREGLPGAVTNYEDQLYAKAAAGLDKTPAFNKKMGDLFTEKSKLAEQYANFISEYYKKKGHTIGANEIWDKYTEQNPLVILSPTTGDLEINKNRPSWKDFLSKTTNRSPSGSESSGRIVTAPDGKRIKIVD